VKMKIKRPTLILILKERVIELHGFMRCTQPASVKKLLTVPINKAYVFGKEKYVLLHHCIAKVCMIRGLPNIQFLLLTRLRKNETYSIFFGVSLLDVKQVKTNDVFNNKIVYFVTFNPQLIE
jgi:hypothetical protein